jgi:hypothetical protein
MKDASKLILLWACSLGLTFFIGWQQGRTGEKAKLEGHFAKPSNVSETRALTPGMPSTIQRSQSVEFAERSSSGEIVPGVVLAAKSNSKVSLISEMRGDPVQRVRAFSEAVMNLNEDNLPDVLAAFDTLPKGFQRYTELRMLMHSWVQMDPHGALEYAKELSREERRFGIMAALSSWATNDSDAALEWAELDSGKREDNPLMPAVIAGVAKSNMEKATSLLFEMEYGHNRGQALRMIINENLQKGGTTDLIRWANSIPADRDEKLTEGISSMVASQLADYDLTVAGKWAKGLDESQGRERAIGSIVREMAEESYDTAKEFLSTLPAKDQYAAMPEVVRKWAYEDPTAAGEWLNQFPATEDLDSSISTYVRSIRTKDPEKAKEWALSIINEETRNNVVESLDKPIEERNGFFRSDGGRGRYRVRVE